MKAQSLITQFIIFFIIGLIIFLSVGNLFKFHTEVTREDIVNSSLKLTNSFISSAAITSMYTCKQCDTVSFNLQLEESVGGYFTEVKLNNVLNVSTISKYYSSSMHNINESVNIIPNNVSSTKPITLTFDRTKNNLMIK
jgi:hypothetical protein